MKQKGGFVTMILAVLGIVLYVTMFENLMSAFDTLVGGDLTDFIALAVVIGIAPTVLLLGGIFAAGVFYWRGYKSTAQAGDPSGLMRMVLGVLILILFVTLFNTILESFAALYALYELDPNYIAFDVVLTIVPTILFLGGIFAGLGTAVGGYRARRRRRALAR